MSSVTPQEWGIPKICTQPQGREDRCVFQEEEGCLFQKHPSLRRATSGEKKNSFSLDTHQASPEEKKKWNGQQNRHSAFQNSLPLTDEKFHLVI
jgi:hypothetical protein